MGEQPFAEAYEKLKDLRRRGDSRQLRALYDDVRASQDRLNDLIRNISANEAKVADVSNDSAKLFRVLEIRTLADRVFGDEKRAEAWLHRPNAALSGQKPIDLLNDELGAAVVRETLEQIDSGIFA